MRGTHLAGFASLAFLVVEAPNAFAQTPAEEAEACLTCHADDTLSKSLENGEGIVLQVHQESLAGSVHRELRCTSCHSGLQEVPHPERTFKDLNQWQEEFSKVCSNCHQEIQTRVKKGVHKDPSPNPKMASPTCVRCHGSHDMSPPAKPRKRISAICATCHPKIAIDFSKSIHGRALIEEGNNDVPVCTDCHRAHDIEKTADQNWRFTTPKICGRCHANEKIMKKYGLSTAVLSSYLADFHGTTTKFGPPNNNAKEGDHVVALCPDCHGVHDIQRVRDPRSSVFRDNLVQTCRKCHEEATANFPAAWLSHYEPTLTKAPMVYFIKWFYRIIIPCIIGGLILQILLHIRRRLVK
jgi:hypothetical protein